MLAWSWLVSFVVLCTSTCAAIDAPDSLFGAARTFSQAPTQPGVHPRVLFNEDEWNALVDKYATDSTVSGTWANHYLSFTSSHGPNSQYMSLLDAIDLSGKSSDEIARLFDNIGTLSNGNSVSMNEPGASALFISSLHAFVDTKKTGSESPIFNLMYARLDKWARIVLAHADKYDCYEPTSPVFGTCTGSSSDKINSKVWEKEWVLDFEWRTGVYGMALSFDVLYNRMGATADLQAIRETVRSAISRIVKGRRSWGMGFPERRLVSNWVTYHCNMYLSNLAIEGEGSDDYIQSEYPRVIDGYMKRIFYPSGASLEDGYVVGIALREGSSALVALARRGQNHIDTQRFRNFLYHTAHMYEPWFCGSYIGGSSGGGVLYTSSLALGRYAYPNGALPKMLWRQRVGENFMGDGVCRALYQQVITQTFLYGGDHDDAVSHPGALGTDMPLFQYAPVRGVVVARSDRSTDTLYTHFDARGDCFMLGHDNADRGTFTLSAFGKTFVPERESWRYWLSSKHHSLLHIDGLAQEEKAPCPRMLSVSDDEDVVLACADLTKSYALQWYPAWVNPENLAWYSQNGWTEETSSPLDFGWHSSAYDDEIGLPSSLNGDADFGFLGTWNFKKEYKPVQKVIRSTAHHRGSGVGDSFFLVCDVAEIGDGAEHDFEFYTQLAEGISESTGNTRLTTNGVIISLTDGEGHELEVHVASHSGNDVSYEIREISGGQSGTEKVNVLVIQTRSLSEELWILFHPKTTGSSSLGTTFDSASKVLSVSLPDDSLQKFAQNDAGCIERYVVATTAPPTTSTSTTTTSTTTSTTSTTTTTTPTTTSTTSTTTTPTTTATSTTSTTTTPTTTTTSTTSTTTTPTTTTTSTTSTTTTPTTTTTSTTSTTTTPTKTSTTSTTTTPTTTSTKSTTTTPTTTSTTSSTTTLSTSTTTTRKPTTTSTTYTTTTPTSTSTMPPVSTTLTSTTTLATTLQSTSSTPVTTVTVKQCHSSGERCMGAPRRPFVDYLNGCCDEKESCLPDPSKGWGGFCKVANPTCHASGDRCMGAAGRPFVDYLQGCCDPEEFCMHDPSRGWGRFCSTPSKQCHSSGERCRGGAGKPFVYYLNGCCNPNERCLADASLGWGGFCKQPLPWWQRGCRATGQRCKGAPGRPFVEYMRGCCSQLDACVEDPAMGWGSFCKRMEFN